MPEPAHIAVAWNYLAPPDGSSWRWSEDGEALEWVGGGTIAFRSEAEAVLKRLAPNGLPPFAAVVYVLSACRDNWAHSEAQSSEICQWGREAMAGGGLCREPESPPGGRALLIEVAEVISGLDRIYALPRAQRAGLEQRARIAEMVFEGSPQASRQLTASGAAMVLQAFSEGLTAERLKPVGPYPPFRRIATFTALREGLARFDASALELRSKTGLDALPEPAELDVPPVERVRRLLEATENDPELGAITRLARNLMAAVHIARPVGLREELPLGGISDIANRGSLDRLLVSELANDDLTLAVRVALNEALYLRRETPPETPRGRRAVLLDVGIRMWGVPRVFAAAVGLALAATADLQHELCVFRAQGEDVQVADLTTRQGLLEHLAALAPEPQPGPALRAFLERAGEGAESLDAIVVTHADCLNDPEFRRALPDDAERFYCATVDRGGAFQLWAVTPRGQRLIRGAQLKLDDLMRPRDRRLAGTPLINPEIGADLPIILRQEPFPLLLPAPLEGRWTCQSPAHGVVAVATDGRLLHFRSRNQGGRQLSASLPPGQVCWLAIDPEGVARLLVSRSRRGELVLVSADLGDGRVTQVVISNTSQPPAAVLAQNGVLIAAWPNSAQAFDPHSGARLGTLRYPDGVHHRHGRFCMGLRRWHALAWDGGSLRLEDVPVTYWKSGALLAVFDREGLDGPWGLTRRGFYCRLHESEAVGLKGSPAALWAVLAISPDGHRLLVAGPNEYRARPGKSPEITATRHLADLKSGTLSPANRMDPKNLLVMNVPGFTNQKMLRTRLYGAYVDTGGRLVLMTGRRGAVTVSWSETEGQMRLVPSAGSPGSKTEEGCAWPCGPKGQAIKLKAVTLNDGSRIFLDSRGLVHLKSADNSLPETTLVLCDRDPLAGWCSDGAVCGSEFFLPDGQRSAPATVYANVRRFIERLQ